MDETLRTRLGENAEVALVTDTSDEVLLPDGAKYRLKALAELYGPGKETTSIDTSDERQLTLLMALESAVLEHDHRVNGLTDGGVLLAMERIGQNPEAPARGDALLEALQLRLRVFLSLHDFNRQEVRLAGRKLVKSIQRQARTGGTRAYLGFIHQHVPHQH